jgi:hypothetical protein
VVDALVLVKADDGLGKSIVIRFADAADQCDRSTSGESWV